MPEIANPLESTPVDLETLTRALLRQANPPTVPDGEMPEIANPLESTPVDLETLTRALLRQANPSTVPDGEMPEIANPLESTPVDLETLTRALLRQANPSTIPDGEMPEMADDPQVGESASGLPSWLARQLNSDGSQTWVNTAIFASTASGVLVDPLSDSLREGLLVSSTSDDHLLESTLDLKTTLEFGESAEVAPTGAARTPGTTTETPTLGTRLQTLDLNRLLQPGGEQRLAEQVRWSVDNGLDTAEIKLHPPSLGTLDVRLVQEGDKTHVQFVSAHPVAREVLEAAMPRLREALAQDGVLLGNVSVSDQTPKNDRGGSGRERSGSAKTSEFESEDDEMHIETRGTISVLSRRLDVFS
ncbi:hypothetical protein GJ668_04370 [Allochromatium palmeri]|uniref:Flagellar hook-length control protein-like C-terminal domain-containing protein n=2 Tax=Allochromatium palmeri TaxID=231048 RepID=A0A6N8EA44_9GAMM|nr:flagellar hook-length control protein FliK [Allochromatium palmeri]MTW20330.1 hypothetical protein [Allochromatium palmeri]